MKKTTSSWTADWGLFKDDSFLCTNTCPNVKLCYSFCAQSSLYSLQHSTHTRHREGPQYVFMELTNSRMNVECTNYEEQSRKRAI